jgi:hypothetical protein
MRGPDEATDTEKGDAVTGARVSVVGAIVTDRKFGAAFSSVAAAIGAFVTPGASTTSEPNRGAGIS